MTAGAPPSKPLPPGKPAKEAGPWRPDFRWHLKALAGIYAALLALYFLLDAFLSRVPPPYRLREVSPEVTPWLKK